MDRSVAGKIRSVFVKVFSSDSLPRTILEQIKTWRILKGLRNIQDGRFRQTGGMSKQFLMFLDMFLIMIDHRKSQNVVLKMAEFQNSRMLSLYSVIIKSVGSNICYKVNKVDKRAS